MYVYIYIYIYIGDSPQSAHHGDWLNWKPANGAMDDDAMASRRVIMIKIIIMIISLSITATVI